MPDDLVQRLRDATRWSGLRVMDEAADRIEALEELLRESLADPDMNWKTAWADEVREALDAGRGEGSSEPAPRPGRLVAMETRLAREAEAADRIEALEAALRSAVLELNRVTEAPNGWPHYTPADFPLPEDREALDV